MLLLLNIYICKHSNNFSFIFSEKKQRTMYPQNSYATIHPSAQVEFFQVTLSTDIINCQTIASTLYNSTGLNPYTMVLFTCFCYLATNVVTGFGTQALATTLMTMFHNSTKKAYVWSMAAFNVEQILHFDISCFYTRELE